MYAIMDLINEPYEKLHEYFPKDGIEYHPQNNSKNLEGYLSKQNTNELLSEPIEITLKILCAIDGTPNLRLIYK